jgi:hypothetical protein
MAKGDGSPLQFDRPVNLRTVEQVAQWVDSQLQQLERVLNEGVIYVRLVPISTEPPRPRNGMVVYAADPWATDDLAGPGLYCYVEGNWEPAT